METCRRFNPDRFLALQNFMNEKGLTISDIKKLISLINDDCLIGEKVEEIKLFNYLLSMIGAENTKKIVRMSPEEKANRYIIILGKQGPTGKTTLKNILQDYGYKALELEEQIVVELNQELQCIIPRFKL